jgi:ribosomal protein S14
LMRGYERLSDLLPKAHPGRKLLRCERCGDASASHICKACEILDMMK